MEGVDVVGRGYALGPRVPLSRKRETMEAPSPVWDARIPSRVMARETSEPAATSDRCANDKSSPLCEKPTSSSVYTIPIALGVAIPLVALISVLLFLHRRHVKKLRKEDAQDPLKSMDFGLDEAAPVKGGKPNRRSMLGGREKDNSSRFKQMSMDMNLSSPYLLPPALHSSRESLHSLARTIHQNEDPYRPITQLTEDGASTRSASRGPDGSSTYTGSSRDRDSARQARFSNGPGPRQNFMPRSAPQPAHIKQQPVLAELSTGSPAELSRGSPAELSTGSPPPSARDPFRSPSERSIETSIYPEEPVLGPISAAPEIQAPAPTAHRLSDKPMPLGQPSESGNELGWGAVQHSHQGDRHRSQQAVIHERGPSAVEQEVFQGRSPPQQPAALPLSPPTVNSLPASPHPQRVVEPPVAAPILEEPHDYYDDYTQMPHVNYEQQEYPEDEGRGRAMYRESIYDHEQQQGQAGLGIPQLDTHRLSVGFRPLPPDELMDTEDPETRANRIRSFYKEYFDDSKPDGANRQTRQFTHQQQQQQQYQQHGNYPRGAPEYYEDYDQHYVGSADDAYYDPSSNAFVTPYAQPVARRAMTPPPSGSRFAGPRGPPRGVHGSMGGMSMPGGRGPQRPGSSASNRHGPPRTGSAMSGAWGRPRAGSSMSAYGGGRNGPPKKALPPPSPLTTLPTPSKLKDDSFAIFNALDFAPPDTFRDRAAGRSQSPLGERRPYQPAVPAAASPLANAFEELPSLPSPHLLQKDSGTFTGLDFAPPRKFVEADNRSETGSIRSNRSGISAVQLGAIRHGAGRISKLPGDTVFTQAAMQEKLKPLWSVGR